MTKLRPPLGEGEVRKLSCGDLVEITGVVYTARDMAHKWLACGKPKEFKKKLDGGAIYHCGPVVAKKDGAYRVLSAGPTTSMREEPYMADIIRGYRVRAVVGKGGMGIKTLAAMKDVGCVYLSAVGGAGAVLADAVREVVGVHKLDEFGAPEAVWELAVENLPAVVSMDSRGKSLHESIYKVSRNNYERILEVY